MVERNLTPDTRLTASCRRIAAQIGDPVTPARVKRLIEISNTQGHLVHGIKREDAVSKINREGLLPLTPEGGNVSFWASGYPIFASSLEDKPLQFFDTPFFHYSFSTDRDKTRQMALALTNPGLVRLPNGIRSNSQHQIGFAIPREQIALILVRMRLNGRGNLIQEAYCQLEKAICRGYMGGELRQIDLG